MYFFNLMGSRLHNSSLSSQYLLVGSCLLLLQVPRHTQWSPEMAGTSICGMTESKLVLAVGGGAERQAFSWPFGHSWTPWFGFQGARQISQRCEDHLKPSTLKCNVLFFDGSFESSEGSHVKALECVPFACSEAVIAKLFACQWEKNTKVFLCLTLWFEEITQDRTANLCYCCTSSLLRSEKIAAGCMQIDSARGGSSQLPVCTRQKIHPTDSSCQFFKSKNEMVESSQHSQTSGPQ